MEVIDRPARDDVGGHGREIGGAGVRRGLPARACDRPARPFDHRPAWRLDVHRSAQKIKAKILKCRIFRLICQSVFEKVRKFSRLVLKPRLKPKFARELKPKLVRLPERLKRRPPRASASARRLRRRRLRRRPRRPRPNRVLKCAK